jgi:hypothetical protein
MKNSNALLMLMSGILVPAVLAQQPQPPGTPRTTPQDPPRTTPQDPTRPADRDLGSMNRTGRAELMTLRSFLDKNVMIGTGTAQGDPAGVPVDASGRRTDAGLPGAKHECSIHDAMFDTSGSLQSVILESKGSGTATGGTDRPATGGTDRPATGTIGGQGNYKVLPARDLRWDASRQTFVTSLDQSRIDSLPAHEEKPIQPGNQPPTLATGQYRATQLLHANTSIGGSAGLKRADEPTYPAERKEKEDAEKRGTGATGGTAGAAGSGEGVGTIWFDPDSKRLAFATVKANGNRLVPWSLVQARSDERGVVLAINTTKDKLEGAPTVESDARPPEGSVRKKAYDHFGAVVPDWDRDAGKDPMGKDPMGKDPSKGK